MCCYQDWRSWCWHNSSRRRTHSEERGRGVAEEPGQAKGRKRCTRIDIPASADAYHTCTNEKHHPPVAYKSWGNRLRSNAQRERQGDTCQIWVLQTETPPASQPWKASGCRTANLSKHTMADTNRDRLLSKEFIDQQDPNSDTINGKIRQKVKLFAK